MDLLLATAGPVIRVIIGLAVTVGGLLMASRWLGARKGRDDRVIALTTQHSVHVVEIDGRRLLVGTGPAGPPSLLYELTRSQASGSVDDP